MFRGTNFKSVFFRGYVKLKITGYSPEKFVNIAARRGVFLKNISYTEKRTIHADVDVFDLKKLRPVAFKSKCKMSILKKWGRLFLLKNSLKRKVFFLGGLCSFVLLIILSNMIASVEINAPVTISKQQIMDLLSVYNAEVGSFKSKIDDEELAKKIAIEIDGVSWAEVTIKGNHLRVDTADSIPKPNIVPYTEPCNIVAVKDGVIHTADIKNGTTLVKSGDTVLAGDILVSGTMNHKFDEEDKYQVHAHGEVKAVTWYRAEQVINTIEVKRLRTGKEKQNSVLKILGVSFGIKAKTEYSEYDTMTESNTILLGKIRLPITKITETYYEVTEEIMQLDSEESMKLAKDFAYEKCLAQMPDNIEIIDVKFSVKQIQNDGLCVVAVVECIEDIGIEKPIEAELPLEV